MNLPPKGLEAVTVTVTKDDTAVSSTAPAAVGDRDSYRAALDHAYAEAKGGL